ncbi:MAG: ABC transporter permease subunit [Nannocystaceae bacterium]
MNDRVFGVGYRRLPGRGPARFAPWPIARTALTLAWRKRSTKLGAALCALVVFGHGMALTSVVLTQRLTSGSGNAQAAALDAVIGTVIGNVHTILATFIGVQLMATAFLLAIMAAGLIAEDRRSGAMELYFSRPLTRRDYLLGKLLAAGLVPVATMVVPFVLLWLLAAGMSPPGAVQPLLGLLLPGLAGTVVAAALLTTTILGGSALGERERTVGVVYVVGLLMLTSLGDELPEAGYPWAGYLSPLRNVQTLVDAMLDAGGGGVLLQMLTSRPETNPSVALAVACVLGLTVLGLGVLVWRVRKEVSG